MKIINALQAIAASIVLTACVSVPPPQQPIKVNLGDSYEIYRAPTLDQTNHTLQHLNQNKDILYSQTYGGGGVGVGLLLGPLGVAANIKAIESNTMKDVAALKNKIDINPNQVFVSSANKNGLSIKTDSSNKSLKFSPYLLVEKTEGDIIMLAAAVLIDQVGTKQMFPTKYLVQLPITYTLAEMSNLDATKTKALESHVEQGFATLIARIKSEATANPEAEEKITMVSEFLTPRFKFEMAGSLVEKTNEYTWVRMVGGVCGVRHSDITVKKVSAKK
jgi:hypothetical protein